MKGKMNERSTGKEKKKYKGMKWGKIKKEEINYNWKGKWKRIRKKGEEKKENECGK